MTLLAIDTTGACSSVAINKDGMIVQIINESEFSHLQRLVPTVDGLMKQENIKPEDLDAIAVSRGPGSFTGIRIGMATAKGLAQIWNKPVIEVPTLASFAFRTYSRIDDTHALCCPVFDAKRHQIYGGAYMLGSDVPLVPDAAYDLADYLDILQKKLNADSGKYGKLVFFGDGVKAYKDQLDGFAYPHTYAADEDLIQTAEGTARLGEKLFKEGIVTDCYTAAPEYLRAAEAERKLAEKIKADSVRLGTADNK